MQKVIVRYIGEPQLEQMLVIHPADEMRAKRELAGKEWADKEYRVYYHCWLCAKRLGLVAGDVKFDLWLEGVAEVEPIMSVKQIDDALAIEAINEKQAEYLRGQVARQESEAPGESQPPPT
jgi:hypothetical protein